MYCVVDVTKPRNRYEFGFMLRERGYRKAIEIGTDLGSFANALLSQWDGELISCDDYRPYEWNKWPRESDMMIASMRLARHDGRGRIAQTSSVELAKNLPMWFAEQLDFVYIDGDHQFTSVCEDLRTWWPFISMNGMIAGHDFDEDRHPEVHRAVHAFANNHDVTIHRVVGDGHCYSWYIERAESFSP